MKQLETIIQSLILILSFFGGKNSEKINTIKYNNKLSNKLRKLHNRRKHSK